MNYFLGVDAGNSKTVALIADEQGRVAGWGRGGGGDIYASETGAVASVATAIGQALDAAGLRTTELAASCLSLVGADWPEDFAFWQREAEARHYGQRVQIVNDALGALRAGTAENGVAVVCGTGAAVGARRSSRVWHSSFWQEPTGGLELSERALRAVYRAELGLGPETLMTSLVQTHFEDTSVEAVLYRLTARSTRSVRYATGLSRLLLDAAAQGDAVACEEVGRAAKILGDYAWVAARKVGLTAEPFPLVLAGGVLRHPSTLLQDQIVACVKTKLPQAEPLLAPFEPVVGALMLALESLPEAPTADVRQLATTLPSAEFFST